MHDMGMEQETRNYGEDISTLTENSELIIDLGIKDSFNGNTITWKEKLLQEQLAIFDIVGSPSPPPVHLHILIVGAGELGWAMLDGIVQHPGYHSSSISIAVLLRASTIGTQDATKRRANAELRKKGAMLVPGDIVNDSEEHFGGDLHAVVSASHRERNCGLRGPRWRGSFMFVPEFGPVDLKDRKLRGLGSWNTRLSVTIPKDIGRVAADILLDPQDVHHQVVFVAGDTVGYGDIANLVEKRFGCSWTRELWDMKTLGQRLEDNPDDGMVKYQYVFGAGKGVAWDMAVTVNAIRGISMETVEDYLREMKE
ncbi:hypothetical protein F5Y16DRAFT_418558 [Xylariaceae sp. FL0255]|nr:hypothetical protein F5Y16DRAFT_418558 [Xylariaceae sp. FL0255]